MLPLVYEELRRLAAQKFAHEKLGQALEATALVHEAYLRLVANAGYNAGGSTAPQEKDWVGVVEVPAPLIVEGLELVSARPAEGGLAQLFMVASDLRLTHCRVIVRGPAWAVSPRQGRAEIQRSEILTDQWHNLHWSFEGPVTPVVNESLLAGAHGVLFFLAYGLRAKMPDGNFQIRNSTLAGQNIVGWLVEARQPMPTEHHQPIAINISGSVLALRAGRVLPAGAL